MFSCPDISNTLLSSGGSAVHCMGAMHLEPGVGAWRSETEESVLDMMLRIARTGARSAPLRRHALGCDLRRSEGVPTCNGCAVAFLRDDRFCVRSLQFHESVGVVTRCIRSVTCYSVRSHDRVGSGASLLGWYNDHVICS